MQFKMALSVICCVSGVCCISAEAVISVIIVWDGPASTIALFVQQLHCTAILLWGSVHYSAVPHSDVQCTENSAVKCCSVKKKCPGK